MARQPLIGPGSYGRELLLRPQRAGGRVGRALGAQKLLGATFWLAVGLITIDATKDEQGEHHLPRPRRYAAVVLLWFIFGLLAELGGEVARFVGALAALVTLSMVLGKAGQRALAWLSTTGASLAAEPGAAPQPRLFPGGVFGTSPHPTLTLPPAAVGGHR